MLDRPLRRVLEPGLTAAGTRLADAGVRPVALTAVGWLVGVAACVAAATGAWWVALALWLGNRVLDGLDGAVARRRGATELGGFLDIVADFSIYAGFVLAVAVARPEARLACVALLVAYYLSATAFLAVSSLIERRGGSWDDGRSLRFIGGLAEGTETVIAYVLFCVFPAHASVIAEIFAVAVAITAVQRIALGVRLLRDPAPAATRCDPSPRPKKS